jgi:hypothetical protein
VESKDSVRKTLLIRMRLPPLIAILLRFEHKH